MIPTLEERIEMAAFSLSAHESLQSDWRIEIEISIGEVCVHLKDPRGEYVDYDDDADVDTVQLLVAAAVEYSMLHCADYVEE